MSPLGQTLAPESFRSLVWSVGASLNPVAADALAAWLMGFDPGDIGYLRHLNEKGLGLIDPGEIYLGVGRRNIAPRARQAGYLSGDPGVALGFGASIAPARRLTRYAGIGSVDLAVPRVLASFQPRRERMELWQGIVMVIIGWLLLGLTATIIPHRSAAMRAKLIAWSRMSLRRSFNQHAKRTRRTPRDVGHAYGFLDREETHLGRSYFGLTLMGPFAFLLLWSISRMRPE